MCVYVYIVLGAFREDLKKEKILKKKNIKRAEENNDKKCNVPAYCSISPSA
jgi:hypothetical protein